MAAACASAASLRGDGVEEVGEQFEHFPVEHVHVDRRLRVDEEATEVDENIHDEWPDEDIVGHIVEDENQIYVDEYVEGDEEEHDEEAPMMGEFVDGWSGEDMVVNVSQDWDEDDYDEDARIKLYARDENSVTLVGTDLMGEAVDQYDRREAVCDSNKSEFKILLRTDLYGYETKWKLINTQNNKLLAEGPPVNSNYADSAAYSGRWCLSPGQYKFQMIDNGFDGICSNNPLFGCGMLMMWVNGQNAGRLINDRSNWRTKDLAFVVGISSRIDAPDQGTGNGNGSSNSWCSKVRSVMQVPKGTCTLPNGQRGHRVRVTTKVDKYGKETSWKITRNNSIKMAMNPVVAANQQKSVEDCLPAGEYNLKFNDMDGICCRHGQGFFKLIVNGQELLNGGAFTTTINHDFQLGFDWISSMS